jgi:hypothetical protein
MNTESLVKSYEKDFFGRKYLYIPNEGSKKLLILLSAHNQGNRYFLLKSFLTKQNHNLLFITNPENNWYLDDDLGELYLKLIKSITDTYDNNNVFIFGSSMAGYAAIHFSIKLNVNCLTCNPQVNLNISMDYGWYELNKNISKLISKRKALPLEELLNKSFYSGVMCIVHGHAPIDVANVELILGSSTAVRKLLVYTLDTDDHAMPFGRDVEKVYQALELISGFSSFNLQTQDASTQISNLRLHRKNAIENEIRFPYRRLSNFYKPNGYSWRGRHGIKRPGVYFFEDIGSYNKFWEIGGALVVYDGDRYEAVTGKVRNPLVMSLDFDQPIGVDFLNNQIICNNAWLRVPIDGHLCVDSSGVFSAVSVSSKNCYLNWDLLKEINFEIQASTYVTCFLDVDIDKGDIIFSVGAYGESGYYQSNKRLDISGQYVLVFQISSIDLKHKDALFSRIYFYPDGIQKKIKIKKFAFAVGNFPDNSFWL